ncbi:MAG TPA: 2TM domain-containing protein [Acidimicrobiales bacterium]|nr:2TM domain-containing protein [Acidimicrobiales bacterium]
MATHDMDHQDTDNQDTDNQDAGHQSEEWKRARKRVTDRRDFGAHLVAFAVVNGFLVLVWAVTGGGYFWPAWLLGLWGMGLVLHGWDVFFRRPVTDADVEAELRRRRP